MAKLKSPTEIGGMPIIPEGAAVGEALIWDGMAYTPADPGGVGTFLPLSGGTMTGFIELHAGPVDPLHATTKQYVDSEIDSNIAAAIAGIPLPYLPLAGGTMTGAIAGFAGTEALPGYSFNGDPNTGIYRVGADSVGISCGAVGWEFRNGSLRMPNGAVGSPVLSFLGDTNTGFYWVAADEIGVSLGGAAGLHFRADQSGSLGTTDFGSGFTGLVGAGIAASGILYSARSGSQAMFIGRVDAGTAVQVVRIDRAGTQVGNINVSAGATAYVTSSDARLKRSIKAVGPGLLEAVRKLKVKQYSFKADPDHRTDRGLLAQEVYEVYPEAVTPPTEESDQWWIDYGRLTPLLLGALNELADRVEALEAT